MRRAGRSAAKVTRLASAKFMHEESPRTRGLLLAAAGRRHLANWQPKKQRPIPALPAEHDRLCAARYKVDDWAPSLDHTGGKRRSSLNHAGTLAP
jgi:hypothetical protein